MKLFKKLICIGLVALMLLASVVSCGVNKNENEDSESQVSSDVSDTDADTDTDAVTDTEVETEENTDSDTDAVTDTEVETEEDTESETESETETEKEYETDQYGQIVYDDPTEGLDFGRKTINILIRSGDQYAREWFMETPSTSIDHRVYARNQAVQRALNVRLNYIPQSEGDNNEEFNSKVTTVGNSGLGGIDIVSAYAAWATNQMAMSFYLNWFDSAELPYLNLDRNYWNQNFMSDGQAFDRLYVNVGDMNLSVYDRCMVVFFNKAKAEEYIKDSSGDPLNLYELVQSGEWYYEDFLNMTKDIYEDTVANQGTRENDDFYGVIGLPGSDAPDAFLYSLGGRLTVTEADGTHSLIGDTDLIALNDIFEKTANFWYSTGAYFTSDSYRNADMFGGGHALFTVDVVYHHSYGLNALYEMEDGYGIIPMPKLNEDQEEYITGVQDAHNVLSIMDSGADQNFEAISAVLEKMAYESYRSVRPYYIETVLKQQNMDYNSSVCFNYVLNGIHWDFSDVYCSALDKPRESLWRTPFKNGGQGFDSRWGIYNGQYSTKLSDLDSWLII